MSSATTSELDEPTGRFVVTREKIEKATNGFLEFERRLPETIICSSKKEADAYTAASESGVSVEIHDLDEVDENGISLYLHDLISSPDLDPERYVRCRLDWIDARLVKLGYHELERLMFLHPDGRIEPSNGKPLYPGASKKFMYVHLSDAANLDSEVCQLAIVGEMGVHALKASDEKSRSYRGMVFSAKFEKLLANYRHGETYTFGKSTKSRVSRGGKATGEKKTAARNAAVAIVIQLIQHPDVFNRDDEVLHKNVMRAIKKLNSPALFSKAGKMRGPKTIQRWIDDAKSQIRQEANRLSAHHGNKLA